MMSGDPAAPRFLDEAVAPSGLDLRLVVVARPPPDFTGPPETSPQCGDPTGDESEA